MNKYHSSRRGFRKGNVAVLVAVLLTSILGLVSFAIDGGMIMSKKRHAQATADSAAMAAAVVLFLNYPASTSGGAYNSSSNNAAATAAINAAAANGFSNSGGTSAGSSTVTVNFPPSITGGSTYNSTTESSTYGNNTYPHKISDGCVEVIVEYKQERYFSAIWSSEPINVRGRAVAKGAYVSPKDGVIVLDYDDKAALADKGGGTVTVDGGDFVINSNNPGAVSITGGSSIHVTGGAEDTPSFNVTGGVTYSGTGGTITTSPVANQIFSGTHPTPDPLAYLPVPTMPAAGTITSSPIGGGVPGSVYTISPGSYSSLPNFGNGDIVNVQSGIVWLDTNFVNNGATVTGTEVMIYQNSGSFSVAGTSSAPVTWSAPTSGPYTGVSFWQPATNVNPGTGNGPDISISGNGGTSLGGTFYAPNALLTLTGNGTGGTGNDFGSQFIVENFKVAGNGNITINYSGGNPAKTRVLALVE